jgi:hypothetical protein
MCAKEVELGGVTLTLDEADCTMQAKNASLYVKSRTPNAFRPLTPSLPKPSLDLMDESRSDSTLTPGVLNAPMSGRTIKVPVRIHLSPAFARSTISLRTMMSNLDARHEYHTQTMTKTTGHYSRSWHTSSGDFTRVLLNSDLLPIPEFRLFNV